MTGKGDRWRGPSPRRSIRAGTHRYVDAWRLTLSRTDSPQTEKGWGQIPARDRFLAIVPEGSQLNCPSGGRLGRHSSRAADRTPGGHEFATISFKDFNKSIKHPFVIYADFESILENIDTVSPNPNKLYTNKYQKHTPCGFCYYIKSAVGDEYNKLDLYRGEDASDEFVRRLEKDCETKRNNGENLYTNVINKGREKGI